MKKIEVRRVFTALAALALLVASAGTAGAQRDTYGNQLQAALSSFNQVPAALATSSGHFQAVVEQDGMISFTLSYANVSSAVTQAHIHFGASKTNGGVMVFLCGGSKPACPAAGTISAADVSTLPATNGDSVIPQGIQPGDLAGLLAAVRSGNSYVNVHTSNFPNGELRGQVQAH